MSGVDERVERAKRSLESLRLAARIDPVLKGWCDDVAAAVAGLEQRADEAEKALEHYANLDPDEVPYRWTNELRRQLGMGDDPHAPAAAGSAGNTEEQT